MKKNVENKRYNISSTSSNNSSAINFGRNNNHVHNGRKQHFQESTRGKE